MGPEQRHRLSVVFLTQPQSRLTGELESYKINHCTVNKLTILRCAKVQKLQISCFITLNIKC